MPTYEYQCHTCKKKFEKLQSMTESPLKKCPLCNGKKVERLIGAGAGFIFKGSGFYITDYKKSGSSKESSSSSSKTNDSKTTKEKSASKKDND